MSVFPTAMPVAEPARGVGLPRRLLLPSFSDLFFLSLIVWLFISGVDGWSRLLLDGDTGWHIRAGEYVLQNRDVPRVDLFSFSMEGKPWFAWEWAADVVFAVLHQALGLKGIALFGGVLIALYAALLLRYTLWRGANVLVALCLTLLAVGASSIHYLARPHLFTLVLLPLSVWIIERDRRGSWWGVWLLIPMAAVWTNLHGGFMALIAVLGMLAVGSSLQALLAGPEARDWRPTRRYWLLAASCSAATIVNPNGLELHRHVIAYLRSDWIREAVLEFQSPRFRNENVLQFELLLLAGMMACAPMLARRLFPEVLWLLFWAHQALASVRHITVFVALAAPLIALEATHLLQRFAAAAPRRSVRRILSDLSAETHANFRWTSLWPVAALVAMVGVDHPFEWPDDFPGSRFPTEIVRLHAHTIRHGRVLTTDQWADYLIYRFYPRIKVYIDGRSDFYGPALGREYVRLSSGQYDWRCTLERHQFTVALIPANWSLGSLLKDDPAWKLLEDDGKGLLFVADGVDAGRASCNSRPPAREKSWTALMKTTRASELPIGDYIGMESKGNPPGISRPTARFPINEEGRAQSSGWLPSGLQLAEFALRGGFIAPSILPKATPATPPTFLFAPTRALEARSSLTRNPRNARPGRQRGRPAVHEVESAVVPAEAEAPF